MFSAPNRILSGNLEGNSVHLVLYYCRSANQIFISECDLLVPGTVEGVEHGQTAEF